MKVNSDVLIRYMAKACCSSKQLLEMSGISYMTLHRMKNNVSVKQDSVGKVMKALDIPYDELIVKED